MWKLWNKLLGWHYVWVKDCGDDHICRVKKTVYGELSGKIFGKRFFITSDGRIHGGYYIENWEALTWKQPKTNNLLIETELVIGEKKDLGVSDEKL